MAKQTKNERAGSHAEASQLVARNTAGRGVEGADPCVSAPLRDDHSAGLGLADPGDVAGETILPVDETKPAGGDTKTVPEQVRGRQGDEGKPYCGVHNVLMRAYASKPDATHYECPVDGCEEKGKRVRPQLKVPSSPSYCPQRTCQRVALVVVPKLSTMAQLHMACPQCRFSLKQPRPQFDAAAQAAEARRRLAEREDLAER